MKELIEWYVELVVSPDGNPSTFHEPSSFFDRLVAWAEVRGLGIGGGCRKEASTTRYSFGLCATRDHQLVSSEAVENLFSWLRENVETGCHVAGVYREFRAEEADEEELQRIMRRFEVAE